MDAKSSAGENKMIEEYYQLTQTQTSSRESCKNAFKEFINNYLEIFYFNYPLMKYFDKSYKKDFINSFLDFRVYEDYIPVAAKKTNVHFRIYPLIEYLALMTAEKKDDQTSKKVDVCDFSVFLKILKQLIMILTYNIEKKKSNKDYKYNIQIYPIFQANFTSLWKDLESCLSGKMNLMVMEMLEVPQVFCFLIPKNTKDEKSKIFSKKGEKDSSFNNMIKKLEELVKTSNDTSNVRSACEDCAPAEIMDLMFWLTDASKNITQTAWHYNLLECVFNEKKFQLSKYNHEWTVDQDFLLEYYLLVQISRMCFLLSSETKLESKNYEVQLTEIQKDLKNLIGEVNKENKDKVQKFFSKNNKSYMLLLQWIGEKDFVKNLILFDPTVIKHINPKHIHKKLTPLSLFYLFLNEIQAENDEAELTKKLFVHMTLESKNDFQVPSIGNNSEPELIYSYLTEFLEKYVCKILTDNSIKMQLDQGIFNEKSVYTVLMPKLFVKYESSLRKESMMDPKEFPIIIEVIKNPISVHLKIRLSDLAMNIENGDELLHFVHTLGIIHPEFIINIEENRKVAIELDLCFQKSLKYFLGMILEKIDTLILTAVNFYIGCIRSFLYFRPTKDVIKYPIYSYTLRDAIRFYRHELKYFYPKWKEFKSGGENI